MSYFYHGGSHPVEFVLSSQLGADGELLCATRSANVSLRYGPVISKFQMTSSRVVEVSRSDWMSGQSSSIYELRESGYEAMIVKGDESFDFPVDTLFVIDPRAVIYKGVADEDELSRMEDGLSKIHDPEPGQLGFEIYARDVYGSINDALKENGWKIDSDEVYIEEFDPSQDCVWQGSAFRTGTSWEVKSTERSHGICFEALTEAISELGMRRLAFLQGMDTASELELEFSTNSQLNSKPQKHVLQELS